jgi:hypothetical protein
MLLADRTREGKVRVDPLSPAGELSFPCERMARNRRDIVDLRLPSTARMRSDFATIRAGSPARRAAVSTRKSNPDTRLTVSITSSIRETPAVAAAERGRGSSLAQIANRG